MVSETKAALCHNCCSCQLSGSRRGIHVTNHNEVFCRRTAFHKFSMTGSPAGAGAFIVVTRSPTSRSISEFPNSEIRAINEPGVFKVSERLSSCDCSALSCCTAPIRFSATNATTAKPADLTRADTRSSASPTPQVRKPATVATNAPLMPFFSQSASMGCPLSAKATCARIGLKR